MPVPRTVPVASPRRRRGWWRPILLTMGALLVLVLIGLVTAWWINDRIGEQRLQAAAAEVDRIDPGWRLEDLERQRAAVPDDENGALIVLAAHKLLPKDWPQAPERIGRPTPIEPDPPREPEEDGPGIDFMSSLFATEPRPKTIGEKIADLPPQRVLLPHLLQELREDLEAVGPAVREARKLKDYPRGRFAITYAPDGLTTRVDHVHQLKAIVLLLELDAVRLCHAGRVDEAIANCRAALNAARALRDEPNPIAQVGRAADVVLFCRMLKRTLALGEPSLPALEGLQTLVAHEEQAPIFLTMMRADRAVGHQAFLALESGQMSLEGLSSDGPEQAPSLNERLYHLRVKNDHAWFLRHASRYVELAKKPEEEWEDELAKLEAEAKKGPNVPRLMLGLAGREALVAGNYKAHVRCAMAALAAERYRMNRGDWPASLQDLVQAGLLKEVPKDPFSGEPLRYEKRPGHRVIYSIADDRVDHDGAVYYWNKPNRLIDAPYDIGFILWDKDQRRLPPVEILAMPQTVDE